MKPFTFITKTHKPFPIFLFLFLFPSDFPKSNAADTLTAGQILTDDGTTLVSSGETYELGFFTPSSPPAGAEHNRYLGIWYKKITQRTYVWVANRDSPATTEIPAVLQLTHLGILTLSTSNSTNSNNPPLLFSSNSSRPARNPVGQLLDSGNFVVREENDPDPANYLWQSFDYPGDTFLPGMKHGRNFVTGLDRVYRSWRASNDPSSGEFTFRVDTHGYPQQFLSGNSGEMFRSGPWNGVRWSGSPGLNPNPTYTYEFVFNEQEVYYKFDLVNPDVYSRLILQPTGVLNRFVWINNTQSWTRTISAPADDCDGFGLCRSYGACNLNRSPICGCLDRFVPRDPVNWERSDWSSGCVRRIPLNNVSCQEDGFIMYSDIKVPDTRGSWYHRNMTLEECRRRCLENCTCTAYTSLDIRNGGSGCLLWFGDLIDIRQYSGNGQDIFIRMASSEIGGSDHKTVKIVAIAISVVAVIVLALALFVWYVKRKKKRQEQGKEQLEMQPQRDAESSEQRYTVNNPNEDLELPLFEFAMIAKATGHFSLDNKLGEGGFGPVYKGMLEGGQEIAVKRLSEYSSQGLHEFKNEVICIAKLQHRNLVRLLGCCIQGEEKLLVYEYMANKSLDIFIFDETRRNLLDWPKCFNIINGTARGLLYLHQDSRLRIIHRDLKASNILLDIDMNPKISDFGMARSFGGNETEANTQKVVGTYGYMSPEYAVDGIFSTKSDVFSFGVLILEIVSGKRNRGFLTQEHHHNLLGHAWILHKQGRSLELIDVNIVDSCYLSEILRSIHVALLCVQQSPEDRPNMSSVVLMLVGEGTLPEPQEPGFFTERNIYFGKDSSSMSQTKYSANHSITLVDAR